MQDYVQPLGNPRSFFNDCVKSGIAEVSATTAKLPKTANNVPSSMLKGLCSRRLCSARARSSSEIVGSEHKTKVAVRAKKLSESEKMKRDSKPIRQVSAVPSDSFVEFVLGKYHQEVKRLSVALRMEAQKRQETFEKSYRYRSRIIGSLRELLVEEPGQYLVPVGSTATGLASGSSDIDLVYISTTDDEHRNHLLRQLASAAFRKNFMTDLKSKIERSGLGKEFDWSKFEIIHTARVPILHLETRQGTQMDIQFEKYASIRNTHFVRCCVEYDQRVTLLNLWAQQWIDSQNLKDSKHGLFSTYHVLMLVLHFLQCMGMYGTKSVLPVVSRKFHDYLRPSIPIENVVDRITRKPKILNYQQKQSPDVAELILLFITHYDKIDLNRSSFRLDSAKVGSRSRFGHDMEPHYLSVIDPYSTSTVCRVKGGAEMLMNAFSSTKKAMFAGRMLNWPLSGNS